jgi:hypothetical protein
MIGGTFEWLSVIVAVFELFIICSFFFGCGITKKVFVSIYSVAGTAFSAIITVKVLSLFSNNINTLFEEQNVYRFISLLLAQLFLSAFYYVSLRVFKKQTPKLSFYEWLILSVLLMFSVLISFLSTETHRAGDLNAVVSELLFLIDSASIAFVFFALYLVLKISKSNHLEEQQLKMKMLMEFQKEYTEKIKFDYENIRKMKHDIRQSFDVIAGLCKKGNSCEILEFVTSQKIKIDGSFSYIDVDDMYLNALINTKISFAKSKGITTFIHCQKSLGQFAGIDLCVLLGNILDNAIEACEKCENPSIDANIILADDNLNILVRNTYNPVKTKHHLETTKPNKAEHGFGIKSIKEIVEKYSGSADFYEDDDGEFVCRVTLKIPL